MVRLINKTTKNPQPLLILLVGIILLFFFGDVAKKIAQIFNFEFLLYTRYSKVIGLITITTFIIYYRLYKKKHAKALIYCLIILSLTFLLSNIFLLNIDIKTNLIANFDYFVKACFLPLFLIPFFSINEDAIKKSLIVIQYIFWVNSLAIIVGYCFDIKFFKTYSGLRFGYMGLFDRSTYSSYLFIFIIIYYYFKYINSKQRKFALGLILAALISLLVGTKRIYFFLVLLGIFHFFYFKQYRNKYFWIGASLILIVLYVFKKNILLSLQGVFNILISIYHEKGLLSAITSLRNDLLMKYIDTFINNNWGFLNYVFGGGFFHEIRPEIAIIDSYLFFGVFGPLIYVFLYVKYIFNFKISNPVVKFLVVILIILSLSSSGIIFSAYFTVLIILFSSFFYFESIKETNFERKI